MKCVTIEFWCGLIFVVAAMGFTGLIVSNYEIERRLVRDTEQQDCKDLHVSYEDLVTVKEGFYKDVIMVVDGFSFNERALNVHVKSNKQSFVFKCSDLKRLDQ